MLLTTYTVTSTGTANVAGTLLYEIDQLDSTGGSSNIINFSLGSGVQTISPTSPGLPTITAPVTIEGTTSSGVPQVQILGGSAGSGANGLTFGSGSSGSSVQDLAIAGFSSDGIDITSSSTGDSVVGCWIGIDTSGTANPNGTGVLVGGSDTTVGGTTSGAGNVVSGNTVDGVDIEAPACLVVGDDIGTNAAGTGAVGNGNGVVVGSEVAMAVMGDSISAGSGVPGGSPNWVAQLRSTFPSSFYFDNEAVGGATSSTVVSDQLPTVESLAADNQITDSVLEIGGNDAASAAGFAIADGGSSASFINTYVSNVEDVINSIAAAGPNVHQVFVNMPDVTVTPLVQEEAASDGIGAAGLQLLSTAIGQADAEADAYALAHNVPVVDLYTASQVLTGAIPITLAGHTFTTAFAPDEFHPAPFMQGLLANMVDMAYNEGFGQSLPILSDQQIVQNVGFTPTGGTTYDDVQPYVLLPAVGPSKSNVISSSGATIGGSAPGAANIISGNMTGILTNGPCLIEGNEIGTNAAGTATLANGTGIDVGGSGATIGGTTTAAGNVISGNTDEGIDIDASPCLVEGNGIGVNAAGTAAMANASGIVVGTLGAGATIGGPTARAGNTISGNSNDGIYILASCLVVGNDIGTIAAGTGAVANGVSGINVGSSGVDATIGGTTTGDANVISGNGSYGIDIDGSSCLVVGNLIGTNAAGTAAVANGSDGIDVAASGATIGGSAAGAANIISGNTTGYGVLIEASSCLVVGNKIGTTAVGTAPLANRVGIFVAGSGATIGGTATGAGNTISGITFEGIEDLASSCLVEGNFIGMNAAGTAAIGNATGIAVGGTGAGATIGGTTAGAGNTISGNTKEGIYIVASCLVEGNFIGTNAAGTAAVANGTGINVSASGATIGGTTTGSANIISGNTNFGVYVNAGSCLVEGNEIGTNAAGTAACPNDDGIGVFARAPRSAGRRPAPAIRSPIIVGPASMSPPAHRPPSPTIRSPATAPVSC